MATQQLHQAIASNAAGRCQVGSIVPCGRVGHSAMDKAHRGLTKRDRIPQILCVNQRSPPQGGPVDSYAWENVDRLSKGNAAGV
ncbi:hypothetical protein T07_8776 [Trichinella nelsoni]|uniref:Uncharacterized protein n=1 Tax=Trichinella nelsoni TaxID=6336 RepID=A0A0V0RUN1_9BILA|nr:hypothetical protein T07_8776 [Trichinella nelsoni]